jgi:hypothetical protein
MKPRALSTSACLFLTVAIVYAVHFAPNVVRETYLAIAIGDRASVRVDPFLGLHPDLFEIPGRGVYINSNPGASFFGAVPYAIARPFFDLLFRLRPSLVAPKPPAEYDDPRPNRAPLMNAMRARGLDVKLALGAAAIHVGLNVPLGGLAAVVMFWFLRARLDDGRRALWLALLFAFGTPIFFRSAFLNQNLLLTYLTFYAFLLLVPWSPTRVLPPPGSPAVFGAGLLLGTGLVCDYSAMPLLVTFGLWILLRVFLDGNVPAAFRAGVVFSLGVAGPILVLLGYQWAAFGDPFLPAQAYMPATQLSVTGWNGVRLPTRGLLWRNLFAPGYGLFVFCPMLLAAFAAYPFRRKDGALQNSELLLVYAASVALYLFCSAIAFAELQWNTGVRYMVPAAPLLFLAMVPVLLHAPRLLVWCLVIPTVTISWAVSMTREDVPTALVRIFALGFELPWHTVLRKTAEAYLPALAGGGSPLAVFVLTGVVLWLIWRAHAGLGAGPPPRGR